MTVKSIFKTLIGTILVIVVSSLLIEMFNLSVVSMQISMISKMAIKQSCELLSQETYRNGSGSGAIAMNDVVDKNGNSYISGDFYNVGLSPASVYYADTVWNKIYNSANFLSFSAGGEYETQDSEHNIVKVNVSTGITDNCANLALLAYGIKTGGSASYTLTSGWDATDEQLQRKSDCSRANMMFSKRYTSANLGIPYMDADIINRMYRWNLAQLLSNCNPENIHTDETGEMYVMFKGFRVYCQYATVDEITYKAYTSLREDVASDYGLSVGTDALTGVGKQQEFYKSTNIKPGDTQTGYTSAKAKDLIQIDVKGYSDMNLGKSVAVKPTTIQGGNIRYDNIIIPTVELSYKSPVTYEGITPLRNIVTYIKNTGTHSGASKDGFDVSTIELDSETSNTHLSTGKYIFTLVN